MADRAVVIRLVDRRTIRCQKLGMAASGPCGNHRFDIVAVLPADHEFTDTERTEFAIIIVTDIPDTRVAAFERRLVERTTYKLDSSDEEWEAKTDRPRIFQIRADRLEAAATIPGLKELFDPEVYVKTPPAIRWKRLAKVVWNKVTQAADVLEVSDGP